jgi:DNA-binding MarR family transcriptional regulator
MVGVAGGAVVESEGKRAGSEDSELSDFLGYNLKRVMSIVQSDLSRVLAAYDLRAVSFSALSVVVEEPGINQTQVAVSLKIERSNLVQIIDELANRKLIERKAVPGDRRRYALMPTAAGRKLREEARTAVRAHEASVFGCLSDAERERLLKTLLKVRSHWAEAEASSD